MVGERLVVSEPGMDDRRHLGPRRRCHAGPGGVRASQEGDLQPARPSLPRNKSQPFSSISSLPLNQLPLSPMRPRFKHIIMHNNLPI